MKMIRTASLVLATLAMLPSSNPTRAATSRPATQPTLRVPVTFTDGHETDLRDHGRPVVLIAAALNVPSEVFREAFSKVTPARGGPPTPAQARRNKEALLRVLGPLGVTNDRLDEVSNYYRYNAGRGEMWRNAPAKAVAIISNGVVTSIEVTEPGSGYSSPPKAAIPGYPNAKAHVELNYGTELSSNGSVRAIVIDPAK